MLKCRNCGNSLEEDALFCGACGEKVENTDVNNEDNKKTFCYNCGERLEEGSVFCPNCRTNLKEDIQKNNTEIKEVSSGIKNYFKFSQAKKIGILFVAVVVLSVVCLANTVLKSPDKKFIEYQKDLLLESGIKNVVAITEKYNNLTNLSTDITLTGKSTDNYIDNYLRDSSITLKTDLDKDNILLNANLNLKGSNVLNGTITYDDGALGFYVPEVEDKYYSINTKNLPIFDGLEGFEIPEIDNDTLSKLAKNYFEILLTVINKDNVSVSKNQSIYLNYLGETVEGDMYIFEPSEADIENVLLKFADEIEKDEYLRNFIKDFLGSNKEWINQYLDNNVEELIDDELKSFCDYIRRHSDTIAENIIDNGFIWKLGVYNGKVCLNSIELESEGLVLSYEGKDNKYVGCVSSYDNILVYITFNYEKTGKLYDGTASIQYDNYSVSVEFKNVDKSKKSVLGTYYGDYTFNILNNTFDLEVSKAENNGTDHTIDIKNSNILGEYIDYLSINLNTTDKKSTAVKPNMDKYDISNDISKLYEFTSNFSYSLDDMFYLY